MISSELSNVDNYERAKQYYSTAPPLVLGRLTISQNSAEVMPLSLDEIYSAVFETVDANPMEAQKYAKTFGKVSVGVALGKKATNFRLEPANGFVPPEFAEIGTLPNKELADIFSAPERDSAIAYLLTCDKPYTSVEMALIQAMHMVDTALVTDQYTGKLPLVLGAYSLDKIKRDYPEIFIRMYGNVRGMTVFSDELGCVLPTSIVEKSGLETISLGSALKFKPIKVSNLESVQRTPASFVGITTAKKPHIGHGLLLAKAVSETRPEGRLLIELNDQGRRVTQAIAALAVAQEKPFQSVASQVSTGKIDMDTLDEAYRNRSPADPPEPIYQYKLLGPNAYYREIIGSILPTNFPADLIADSEISRVQPALEMNDGYVPLFGNSGMALIRGKEGKSTVLKTKGQLTVAGILAIYSSKYKLTLVDSPPPLSSGERAIFNDVGLDVEQSTGTGIMIDFEVASGTKSNTLLLEDIARLTKQKTGDTKLLLPALREIMNNGYFLPSEGASVSLNFASNNAAEAALNEALERVAVKDDPFEGLQVPMAFTDIKRDILLDILTSIYGEVVPQGKPTVGELRKILSILPCVKSDFSERSLGCIDRVDLPDDSVIQKNLLNEKDRQIIQALRVANPARTIQILLKLADQDSEKFSAIVSGSKLTQIMSEMGYDSNDAVSFLTKLSSVKGVYKLL